MVLVSGAVLRLNNNAVGLGTLHYAVSLCHHADAGVHGSLYFHTGSHYGGFGSQKGHRLTLHVGSHQGTVGVIVLQEGNQGRRHGEHHLRRHIHVIKTAALVLLSLLSVTAGHILIDEMSLRVQRRISLSHMVIIFFIGGHVDHFIRNSGILGIRFIHLPVRRLHESILVNSGIAGQGVDQTDVGTFRGLDGAHSPVMGIMHVTHLKSGTVSGKTAGSQSGQTSLVGQLAQRVILIHKLGQLGGSEEFLHSSRHRLDINQGLGGNALRLLGRHSLPHHSFQSGKSDPVLILKQFAHRSDTAVAQMVNIVIISDAVLQVHVVVDGGKNIFLCDMLGNQIMNGSVHSLLKLLRVGILFQKLFQHRIIDQLRDSHFFRIHIHEVSDIYHHAGEHLYIALFRLNPHIGNRRVLNPVRQFSVRLGSGLCQHLARSGIHHVFRQHMAGNPVSQHQLLIKFIPSHLGQIISSGVKKHAGNQALRAFHRQRLAGPDFFVQLQKALLIGFGSILGQGGQKLGFLTEQFQNLRIGADAEGTDQHRDGHLSGSIYTNVKNIIGVSFVFQPCAPVGNHGAGIQLFAQLIVGNPIIDTRRTHQLADDNTFRSVNHEGSRIRHQGQISHENIMLADLIIFLIVKSHPDLQRCGVGGIPLRAFFNRILHIFFAQSKVHKFKTQFAAVVLNRGNIIKNFSESLIQKPLIGILLNLNQIRHLKNFFLT